MKRTFLSMVGIAMLAAFGNLMAQTPTGSTTPDQPAVAAPSQTAPGTPVLQQDSPGTQPGSPADDTTSQPAAAQPAPDSGARAATGTAGHATHSGNLPATASNNPLMALLGAVALAAFTILLVVRRSGPARS